MFTLPSSSLASSSSSSFSSSSSSPCPSYPSSVDGLYTHLSPLSAVNTKAPEVTPTLSAPSIDLIIEGGGEGRGRDDGASTIADEEEEEENEEEEESDDDSDVLEVSGMCASAAVTRAVEGDRFRAWERSMSTSTSTATSSALWECGWWEA